jgi:hypothetical protein
MAHHTIVVDQRSQGVCGKGGDSVAKLGSKPWSH